MTRGLTGSALALLVSALAVACGGDDNEGDRHAGSAEADYILCLKDAGLSDDEIEFLEPPTDGHSDEIVTLEDHPELVDLLVIHGECLVSSGLGEGGLTPERIEESTVAAIGLTECMRGRGWQEFPEPDESPFGGLALPTVTLPENAEQRAQFTDDFDECSIEHLGVPLEGAPDADHDHGGEDVSDHDH